MSHDKKHIKIEFIGAAQTVTGSKTLVSTAGKKILIDCGLFQGPRKIRELNWQSLDIATEIDAIILTHAHVDHSGYLPKLVKDGFSGPIYCSKGTFDLCEIILMDSAYLQEEDARFANKTKHSRHNPALPLYEVKDAEKALKLFKVLESDKWHELFPDISVRLLRSGHILGSSFIQLSVKEQQKSKLITFSGDIGNGRQKVIKGPRSVLETDYLVMEGTYGDRVQPKADPSDTIAECIHKIHKNKGVLVIPAFAVGRTQEILFILRKLENENKIPKLPVYLDSPMATKATQAYLNNKDELNLQVEEGEVVESLRPHSYEIAQTADDSMLLCMQEGPMVVVSAAGMLTGGRVLHHLKVRLPKPENIVLLVGWQADETKGRLLQNGLPKIRIHHKEVDIEAQIVSIDCLSAHGDSQDIINWIKDIEKKPTKIFLNHGEQSALNTLSYRIRHELNLDVEVPDMGQAYDL